jgi:two-component system sensor histidine kinase RegB
MNAPAFAPDRGARRLLAQRALRIARSWLPARAVEADDKTCLNGRLLRLVVLARAIVCSAGLVLVAGLAVQTGMRVPVLAIGSVLAVVGLASWAALARTRAGARATEADLLRQIVADVIVLTAVITLAGGENSPFDHLFLLPVVLGAYSLTGRRMAILAALLSACWSLTLLPQDPGEPYPESVAIGAHLAIGMLVAYFAYAVARLSRSHERMLSGARERTISALGAEASGMVATRAAHTLSTPLGTMAVLVSDLRRERIPEEEREAALDLLAAEIANCKRHLSGLLESTGVGRGNDGYRAGVLEVLKEMREECLLSCPEGVVTLDVPAERSGAPDIVIELSLFNALAGLAKDFVRDAPHAATLGARWDSQVATIRIGGAPGEPQEPKGPHSSFRGRRRERLAVASAIAGRHGGTVSIETGHGTVVVVRLPRAAPAPSHESP